MQKLIRPSYEKEAVHYLVSGIGAALARAWILQVPVDVASVLSLRGPAGLLIGQFAGEMAAPYVSKRGDTTITNALDKEVAGGFFKNEEPAVQGAYDAMVRETLPVIGGFVVVFIAGRGSVTDAVAMTIGSAGALALYDYLTAPRDFLRLQK